MSDKTALIIFSEFVQSLEEVRTIAKDLFMQGESKDHILSDEEITLREMSGAAIHELKATDLYADEGDAGLALLRGCHEIEEKAVEMIKLCLEFTHPL